jgi:hypothetical protein
MSFPGFTAEVSLYASPRHYHSASTPGRAHHALNPVVSPALVLPAVCDQQCRIACKSTCIPDCADLFGSAKAACLRACERLCSLDCGCTPLF